MKKRKKGKGKSGWGGGSSDEEEDGEMGSGRAKRRGVMKVSGTRELDRPGRRAVRKNELRILADRFSLDFDLVQPDITFFGKLRRVSSFHLAFVSLVAR